MTKFGRLQLIGPIALIGAVLSSEGAVYGLARAPSSEWLWYLNLKWFALFQQSHYKLSAIIGNNCEQLLVIALPLLLVVSLGIAFKQDLLIAVASNVSFVYTALVLATAWRAVGAAPVASLSTQDISPPGPDSILIFILVGVSLVSFVVSHLLYIQKARSRA